MPSKLDRDVGPALSQNGQKCLEVCPEECPSSLVSPLLFPAGQAKSIHDSKSPAQESQF